METAALVYVASDALEPKQGQSLDLSWPSFWHVSASGAKVDSTYR